MKQTLLYLIISLFIISCQNTTEKNLILMRDINNKLEQSNVTLQYRIERLNYEFEISYMENPVIVKPYYFRSKFYSNKCDSLYQKIFQLKEDLQLGIDDITLNTNRAKVKKVINKNTISDLYSYFKSLKKELHKEQKEYGERYQNFFNHILPIVEISENDFKNLFDVNSLAEALIVLSGIENDIKRINGDVLSLFFGQIDAGSSKFNPLPNSNVQSKTGTEEGIYCAITSPDYNRNTFEYLKENSFLSPVNEPLTTFSVDVDVASYSIIRRHLNYDLIPPVGAVRIEEMINYFDYNYPEPNKGQPFSVFNELSVCPWNENHQILMLGLQGENIDIENLPPANLVFLIDVSGSMQAENKLPLLKKSMELLVSSLRPMDKVAIVVYAGNAGEILPSTSAKNKNKILKAINNLEAGGSTAGGEGIKLAYKICKDNFIENGNNRVLLATDGDFNVGVSHDNELIKLIEKKRKSNIYLTILGFGFGNFQDAKMEKLSNAGNGNYAYIDNLREAKKVLVNEVGGILFTIAKDVKFQLEFNPVFVKTYRLIGYENRVLQNHEFDDDSIDAGEVGAGHSVTVLYEIELQERDTFQSAQNLKYQSISLSNVALNSNELATLNIRYKPPSSNTSKLQTMTISNIKNENQSDNFTLACSVSEFGLLLRKSQYKANASTGNVKNRLSNMKSIDEKGYRKDLVELIERYEKLLYQD